MGSHKSLCMKNRAVTSMQSSCRLGLNLRPVESWQKWRPEHRKDDSSASTPLVKIIVCPMERFSTITLLNSSFKIISTCPSLSLVFCLDYSFRRNWVRYHLLPSLHYWILPSGRGGKSNRQCFKCLLHPSNALSEVYLWFIGGRTKNVGKLLHFARTRSFPFILVNAW